MIHDYLAIVADPSLFTDYLSAPRKGVGDGTSNNSIGNLVAKALQLVAAIAGLGFVVKAGMAGFGKGSSTEQGKEAGKALAIGAALASGVYLFPKIVQLFDSSASGFF